MPTLKYRDPADGTFKAVPGGSGGGAVYADEAARDAAIPAPTEGQQCYMLNYKANMVFQNGAWAPLPGGAGMVLSGLLLTPPPHATTTPAVLVESSHWGPELGVVSGGFFYPYWAGMYSAVMQGFTDVGGDGWLNGAAGAFSLDPSVALGAYIGYVNYTGMTRHWAGLLGGAYWAADDEFIPVGFTAPASFVCYVTVTYLGPPGAVTATAAPPPASSPFVKYPPKGA